ncbi:MAG: nuclear transport factor 2 family protein [Candidatus Binatus sp.]|jgi:ketosteroid isomerase-like protein|uniref:YybH family protein n=1 Tax=Candidatus Binatus sp. TaxID=2811406 RepID=UPI003C7812D5
MKKLVIMGALVGAIALFVFAQPSSAKESDEAEIRTMEAAMMTAFAAKDLDHALAGYVQDDTLFVFDAIPPRQYVGIKAWRADNEGFLALFQGPVKAEMSDLSVTTNGKLGFGHNIQHFSGTGKDGKPIDLTLRVSDGYKKINGKWMIVEEHISFPVDITTGKADFSSKP